MQLDEFIATTFQQIIEGVERAQKFAENHRADVNAGENPGVAANPSVVEFDVSLTEDTTQEKKGGLGVNLTAFNLGGQGRSESAESTLTRIRFSIPISLARQKTRTI